MRRRPCSAQLPDPLALLLCAALLAACGERAPVSGDDSAAPFSDAGPTSSAPVAPDGDKPSTPHTDPVCEEDSHCQPDEFCERSRCEMTTGWCIRKPNACSPGDGPPECGCDGTSYPSACHRLLAGASLAHEGICTGVSVFTDALAYAAGQPVQASVANGDAGTLFLHGCSAFEWWRLEQGSWTNHGRMMHCFWEGEAVPLGPGAIHSEALFPGGGSWMVKVEFGLGCATGLPLDQAGCASRVWASSPPFTVAPHREDCDALDAQYRAAIPLARSCDPLAGSRCQDVVPDGLYCGCSIYVDDLAPLLPLRREWQDLGCETLPLAGQPCPKCSAPVKSWCHLDGACDAPD